MYPNTIDGYTIFVNCYGEFSYIMGFPSSDAGKHIFDYGQNNILTFFILVMVISILVFSLMGIFVGARLTKPLIQILEGLKQLAEKGYRIRFEEEGMYASIFGSLNRLSENLELNVEEKKKLDHARHDMGG